MKRIRTLFEQKQENILSFYYTAGFPALHDTLPVLRELQAAGADMVEIGIPFSDPLADGPVIQQSSIRSLNNGMNIQELFRQLKDIRPGIHIPVLLMGYLNPVLQYGVSRFCRDAAACGVDGFIIPDLPPEEYGKEWQPAMEEYGLAMTFLATPYTDSARMQAIDDCSSGFIYMVTTAGTTGGGIRFSPDVKRYFSFIRDQKLRNPVLAGFGIQDKADFEQVCAYTRGGIVGSSFIRALETYPEDGPGVIRNFVQSFL